jgi:hypothetical protein
LPHDRSHPRILEQPPEVGSTASHRYGQGGAIRGQVHVLFEPGQGLVHPPVGRRGIGGRIPECKGDLAEGDLTQVRQCS